MPPQRSPHRIQSWLLNWTDIGASVDRVDLTSKVNHHPLSASALSKLCLLPPRLEMAIRPARLATSTNSLNQQPGGLRGRRLSFNRP